MVSARTRIAAFAASMLFVLASFGIFAASSYAYVDTSYLDEYQAIETVTDDTILGADLSYYQVQKSSSWGRTWSNFKGVKSDPITIAKENGINTITVKVAVNPTGENEYLSLANGVKTIKAAKAAGMRTNVVLLFCDWMTWKDVQNWPQAWDNVSDVVATAQDYVASTMKTFADNGATPDIVTIGNDVDWNFLGLGSDWDSWVAIAKAAQAVKDFDSNVKVGVGIAAPGDAEGIKWVLDKLNNNWLLGDHGFDFDYVGVNVYPSNGKRDGGLESYVDTMRQTFEAEEANAGKSTQLYIAKASFLRTTVVSDDANVEDQAAGVYGLLSAITSKNNAGGLVYNVFDLVNADNSDWFDGNSSFFDEYGHAVSSMAVFAKAAGKDVDTQIIRDPYQYGDETGLKDEQVTITKVPGMTSNTIRGVDISSYLALQNAGVVYKGLDGQPADLMKILADNGVNYVRIRVWDDPYNSETGKPYGGGICDLDTAVEIGKRATEYGIKLNICIQYSDFWADPGQQHVPKAWLADVNDPDAMQQHVYDYTKEVLSAFQAIDGVQISMIQVGNEVTNGILGVWSNRDYGGNWDRVWKSESKSKLADSYIAAGIKACRELTPDALVCLQLETPNVYKYTTIMNCWLRDGLDYDVLGSSYYPFWSVAAQANVPSSLAQIQDLAASYGKLFAVQETAWCTTESDADGTPNSIGEGRDLTAYSMGAQGQVNELYDMYKVICSKSNGLGAFYWEPAWIPVWAGWRHWAYNKEMADTMGTGWAGSASREYLDDHKYLYNGEPAWGGSSWDNNAMFDMRGNALQSLRFFKEAYDQDAVQETVISILDPEGNKVGTTSANVGVGQTVDVQLPKVFGFKAPSSAISVTGTQANAEISVTYQPCLDARLTYNEYTYSGTVKKPSVTIAYGSKLLASKVTKSSTKASITYSKGRKYVGKYKVTVKGKGKYAGTKTLYFTIKPKTSFVKAAYSYKGALKAVWAKRTTQVSGYQFSYSPSTVWANAKTYTSTSNKVTSKKVTGLQSKTKYLVKVRTYKVVKGKRYYSDWSKTRTVTTK